MRPFVREDAYGGTGVFGTATTHPCRVTYKSRLLKGADGRDILTTSRIYFGPSSTGGLPGLTVRSRVTLSDGGVPRIVSVGKYHDDEGPYYEVADCG